MCEEPEQEEEDDEEEDDDDDNEGHDEHNYLLNFGRVINDIYHPPVVINSIDELSSVIEEQGFSDDSESWLRVMIGMFMKSDEDEFQEADDIEEVDEEYISELRKMELAVECGFKIFKKSLFLKKHFKRMIHQNKIKQM